jgi:hypothetical protein
MLGRDCFVHAEHDQPQPIQEHHVRPMSRGGVDSQVLRMCANAHGRVHRLLDEIEAVALASPYATTDEIIRTLPEGIWKVFTVEERAVAYHGWQAYGLGFLNGRYGVSFDLWRTDGTPKHASVPHFSDLTHAARWSRRWRRQLGIQ